MSETLEYYETAPPAPLQAHVRCIWRLRGDRPVVAAAEPIIPDGCVEIVLNVGDAFTRHMPNGASHRQPSRLVAGQITRAVAIEPTGRIDLWGIRFHPWSAPAFLGISGRELNNEFLSLHEANGSLERDLSHLGELQGDAAQFRAIIGALTRRCGSVAPMAGLLPSLVTASETSREPMTVRGLARRMGLSARRVQAIFRDGVGLAPKQLMRIARFQRALSLARTESDISWTTIALRAGYYDQAHLIHESQDIAGCTPAKLLGRDAELTTAFLADESPNALVVT